MTVAHEARHRMPPESQGLFKRVALPLSLILVGLVVLLYPVVSTQWNNRMQEQAAEMYEDYTAKQPQQELHEAADNARVYNRERTGGPILDPWLARVSKDNPEYQDYLSQLSGAPAMAQLAIPAIDLRLPIFHGTDEETLKKGLGHLYGTDLPVGGPGTHSVITGHTGLTNATLFDNLDKVHKGDAVYISASGEKLKYVVRDTQVVRPEETDMLSARSDQDLITLITCTPYGINSHRLLVHAERVPMDPEEEHVLTTSTSTIQWWMWVLIAVALAVVLGIARWLRNEKKKTETKDAADA